MATRTSESFEQDAKNYADCAIGSIREMVAAMEHAGECKGEMECPTCEGIGRLSTDYENAKAGDDCPTCEGLGEVPCTEGEDSEYPDSWHDEDRARERIQEDALSVQVRGDWYTPGDEDGNKATEYEILITTGGPAARIVGDLDEYGQPSSARFEYQDWFKPWIEVIRDSADYAVLLEYAQQFYFGD